MQDTPAPTLNLSPPGTANGVSAAAPSSTVAPSAAAVLGAKDPSPPQTESPKESTPTVPTAPTLGMAGGKEMQAAAKGPQTEKLAVDGQSQPDAAELAQRADANDFVHALTVKLENINNFPAVDVAEALGQTTFIIRRRFVIPAYQSKCFFAKENGTSTSKTF